MICTGNDDCPYRWAPRRRRYFFYMKIALVSEYYYPLLGGITEHVHNLAGALSRKGHEVTVITHNLKPRKHHHYPDEPLTFTLEGNYFGQARTFTFNFNLDKATTKNAFVPRLWASRQIGALTDAIRDLGADNATAATNPKLKELVDEIVRLSKEFGILTEYTAFLAREGSDLSQPAFLSTEALKNFDEKALKTRSGYSSINQEFNNSAQRAQACVNPRNGYWDAQMNRVAVSSVQQVNDRAFYKRGNRWVDSSLVDKADTAPKRIVEVGSEEFRLLTQRLAAQSRQGCVALSGEILLNVDGESVLIR